MTASVHAVPSEASRADALGSIVRSAHRYELGPLVYALEQAGVTLDRIHFDGRPQPSARGGRHPIRLAPEGRLVAAAKLVPGEPNRVVIHLTQGLFGPRSPLPSYFQQLLSGEVLATTLGELLHVLDDSLWRGRVAFGHARRGLAPRTSTDQALGEATAGTDPLYLDWVFRQVFPELRVSVARGELPRSVRLDSVFLGHVALGQCALSGHTALPSDAVVVTLTSAFDAKRGAGEYRAGDGETWMEEVSLRLRRDVVPLFARQPVALRVVLRVLASQTQSKVTQTRLGEALVADARPPFEFTLFSGMLGSAQPR